MTGPTPPTAASVRDDLIAEQDALDAVVGDLNDELWALDTPSPRWTIADQIGHLTYFDWTAALAITDPDRFTSLTAELMGAMTSGNEDAMDLATLGDYRAMTPPDLCHAWRTNRGVLSEAAASLADDDRVIWYGPSMGSKSFLTARLMEAWAHGQDIIDTLDTAGIAHADRPATDRLRHIAQLGFITHKWSYINRQMDAPTGPVRVELVAPGQRRRFDHGPGGRLLPRHHAATPRRRHRPHRAGRHRNRLDAHRPSLRRRRDQRTLRWHFLEQEHVMSTTTTLTPGAFELNDVQQQILNEAERFSREQLLPLAQKMDDTEECPDDLFDLFARHGYLGITIPEEYGGQGLGLFEQGLICQAMGKYNASAMLTWGAHDNLCANNIYRNANDDIKQRYLPGMCNGSIIGALGLTEPGAGSDALGSMATTAVQDGDEYILNGAKTYITNGPIADIVLVYAKTDLAAGHRGITAFVLETDTPGFAVAQKLSKMGYRGSPTAELVFDDCRVPAANIVGELNGGVGVVMSGLDVERIFLAPAAVGMAERCLELSMEHATTRKQFDKPIIDFQAIEFKLADMWIGVELAKAYTYRILAMCAEADESDAGHGAIHAHSAAAILYATKMMREVADESVQVHGGAGYMWEMEINRLYRDAKLLEIGAGTQEVRRGIVGKYLRGTMG
jgi:isovaleryl-CoA dehydrogenase